MAARNYPPSPSQVEKNRPLPNDPRPASKPQPTTESSTSGSIANLNRQVFNKQKFKDTVNTSFTQLGAQQPDPSFFDINLATIPDFWILYDKFFYEIPKEGATNSHRYLAQTSGDYADFERIQEEINALLDEISELRVENVELRQDNANLEILAAEARSARAVDEFKSDNPGFQAQN